MYLSGIQADFGNWANNPDKLDIGNEFDGCISSWAIHHLHKEMKLKLFERIAANLTQDGCFWNADSTLPESPALPEVYKAARKEWAVEQGINLTEIRPKRATTTEGYFSQDQLASLDSHLQMLGKTGFKTIAVPWKYYALAVFGGCL